MKRKPGSRLRVLLWIILFSTGLFSCTQQNQAISLGTFTENFVDVSISLAKEPGGNYLLSATFTPPAGYHLYSKDIPMNGVDGLGRPTLLQLTPESTMQATGSLIESKKPEKPDFEPHELLVYPQGPITLSLPVKLPAGDQWVQDEISVTYMACSANQCKPPVEAKVVPVRIPGADVVDIK